MIWVIVEDGRTRARATPSLGVCPMIWVIVKYGRTGAWATPSLGVCPMLWVIVEDGRTGVRATPSLGVLSNDLGHSRRRSYRGTKHAKPRGSDDLSHSRRRLYRGDKRKSWIQSRGLLEINQRSQNRSIVPLRSNLVLNAVKFKEEFSTLALIWINDMKTLDALDGMVPLGYFSTIAWLVTSILRL